MRVLIAPDKFKGTLSALQAASAIAEGWRRARPDDELELLPITDGGDGFGARLSDCIGCRAVTTVSVDAAHRRCRATWYWDASTRTAIIESAAVIGLAMLPSGRFHPFELDTFGLGTVLKAVAARKPRRCLIGIGGSATNDGGFGMALGLGWRFVDGCGRQITRWTELERLKAIEPPARRKLFPELVVAVDVQNPLLGPLGASRVYGPQKGLRPKDLSTAEACLGSLTRVMNRSSGCNWAREPGAGAAGGLGFGLMAFLGAKPVGGFEIFVRYSRLKRRVCQADLVLTGEGRIDRSTLMGKGVGQLAALCRKVRVPCVGFAGSDELKGSGRKAFKSVHALSSLTTVARARANAHGYLAELSEQVARRF